MIRFNNDYNRACHEEILKALQNSAGDSYGGYGLDEMCDKAKNEIKKYLDCENADVHFLVGGTQTNFTIISSLLKPFECVLCADTGHINVHETGAVENTGHKVCALPSDFGKITASQVEKEAILFEESDIKEHITRPKMVYISFPTEVGTIYTKEELYALREVCDRHGLYLFIDGARLGYGLTCDECDVTAADIAKVSDVFYFGGTKCGAMFGEAVVFTRRDLSEDFRSYIKMNGAMLAKGWLLGLQFYTLFKDGLYFDICRNANKYAMMIKKAFADKNIPFWFDSPTNQQFVILENKVMEKLAEKYVFEYERKVDENHACVRFCTAWSTREEEVKELVSDIAKL